MNIKVSPGQDEVWSRAQVLERLCLELFLDTNLEGQVDEQTLRKLLYRITMDPRCLAAEPCLREA